MLEGKDGQDDAHVGATSPSLGATSATRCVPATTAATEGEAEADGAAMAGAVGVGDGENKIGGRG